LLLSTSKLTLSPPLPTYHHHHPQPTPENYPTSAQPPRALKKGSFKFPPGYETYAPTPESDTHAPTPENKKSSSKKSAAKKSSGKRALVDSINYVETFSPTPENYPTIKKAVRTLREAIKTVKTAAKLQQ
jgi:hypothetical protein